MQCSSDAFHTIETSSTDMLERENLRLLLTKNSLGQKLQQVLLAVHDAGGRAFVVGGSVRDALLGNHPHDFDVEVYGLTPQQLSQTLSRQFKLDSVGASFGILKLHGADIDVALPRRETKLGLGHRAFDVDTDPQLSFQEATARRDLTINAILYDPLTDEIVDPWNGQADLEKRILRHVSTHFSEDPLRVLRIMQFTARLDFPVAPETIRLCRNISPENLPRERIGDEWEKLLLKGSHPSAGLTFLRETNWIQYFPELNALVNCPQNPQWHPEGDVWNHTLLTLDSAAEMRHYSRFDNLVLMTAALCHDMGKPEALVFGKDGQPRTPGHDIMGEKPAQSFMRRLWLNLDLEKLVLKLVKCHMRAHAVAMAGTDKAYRRLAVDAQRMDLLADLFEADLRASAPRPLDIVALFRQRSRELNVQSQAPKPIVRGRDLLELGLTPGPSIGEAVKFFYERQLDGDFTTLEEARPMLIQYVAQVPRP